MSELTRLRIELNNLKQQVRHLLTKKGDEVKTLGQVISATESGKLTVALYASGTTDELTTPVWHPEINEGTGGYVNELTGEFQDKEPTEIVTAYSEVQGLTALAVGRWVKCYQNGGVWYVNNLDWTVPGADALGSGAKVDFIIDNFDRADSDSLGAYWGDGSIGIRSNRLAAMTLTANTAASSSSTKTASATVVQAKRNNPRLTDYSSVTQVGSTAAHTSVGVNRQVKATPTDAFTYYSSGLTSADMHVRLEFESPTAVVSGEGTEGVSAVTTVGGIPVLLRGEQDTTKGYEVSLQTLQLPASVATAEAETASLTSAHMDAYSIESHPNYVAGTGLFNQSTTTGMTGPAAALMDGSSDYSIGDVRPAGGVYGGYTLSLGAGERAGYIHTATNSYNLYIRALNFQDTGNGGSVVYTSYTALHQPHVSHTLGADTVSVSAAASISLRIGANFSTVEEISFVTGADPTTTSTATSVDAGAIFAVHPKELSTPWYSAEGLTTLVAPSIDLVAYLEGMDELVSVYDAYVQVSESTYDSNAYTEHAVGATNVLTIDLLGDQVTISLNGLNIYTGEQAIATDSKGVAIGLPSLSALSGQAFEGITQFKAWVGDVEPDGSESGHGDIGAAGVLDYKDGYHSTDSEGVVTYDPNAFDF